jgi:lauroyl/myristoyl acyltransferase
MPDGYARVALRANVPLMFGYSYRTDDGVIGRVFPPLYPDRSLDKEEAVRELVQRVIPQLETAIREHPEQWHLSAPIWRLAQERLESEELG